MKYKYIFYKDGKEIGTREADTLAEAEASIGVKVNDEAGITYEREDVVVADPPKKQRKPRTPKANVPAKEKSGKSWQYFIWNTSTGIGGMEGPMSRADFGTTIESIPDLTKIRAFTGRELKLSRKTIVH